jgi:hypothetical protein
MGRIPLFRNVEIPKLKLLTEEKTYEKAIISQQNVVFHQPKPGGKLDESLELGNTTDVVTVNYNMFKEPDKIELLDNKTGKTVGETPAPVSGGGSLDIPRGVKSVRIKVNPANDKSTTSIYDVNLTYSDERVFVEKKTKFLGITIKRTVEMRNADQSNDMIKAKNTDSDKTNDIKDGTRLKEEYDQQHNNSGSNDQN